MGLSKVVTPCPALPSASLPPAQHSRNRPRGPPRPRGPMKNKVFRSFYNFIQFLYAFYMETTGSALRENADNSILGFKMNIKVTIS